MSGDLLGDSCCGVTTYGCGILRAKGEECCNYCSHPDLPAGAAGVEDPDRTTRPITAADVPETWRGCRYAYVDGYNAALRAALSAGGTDTQDDPRPSVEVLASASQHLRTFANMSVAPAVSANAKDEADAIDRLRGLCEDAVQIRRRVHELGPLP